MKRRLALTLLVLALSSTSLSSLASPLDPSLLRPRTPAGLIIVHQRGAGEVEPLALRDEDGDERETEAAPGVSARAPRGRAR